MADEPKIHTLGYRGPNPGRARIPDDPERLVWLFRRILFRAGVFVLFLPYIFYFGPNYIRFNKFTRPTPADFTADAQRAIPTIRAMKEYQRDHGQLPDSMEELIPKYLPENPDRLEFVHGTVTIFGRYNESIIYDFTPGSEGWSVDGPVARGPIPLPPVIISPATQPTTAN